MLGDFGTTSTSASSWPSGFIALAVAATELAMVDAVDLTAFTARRATLLARLAALVALVAAFRAAHLMAEMPPPFELAFFAAAFRG
ncbi:MAG: hypothetical protein ABI910_20280, partial [Gemmatimonadota bacterium]